MDDNEGQKSNGSSPDPEALKPEPVSPLAVDEPQISDPPPPSSPSSSPSADIPPIITYPEFLSQAAEQAPPLITAAGLLRATYAVGCAAGVVYCAHRYIFSPMITSLVEARHSLAETALSNLTKLNSKLGEAVSAPPKRRRTGRTAGGHSDDDDDDDEEAVDDSDISSDSDPAELFHVDVATQTTPGVSRSGSISQLVSPQDTLASKSSTISAQESTLQDMHNKIASLKLVNEARGPSERALSHTAQDLISYLTSLKNDAAASRRNHALYGGAYLFGASGSVRKDQTAAGSDDAVEGMRGEIRGIKGILLSARNFPAGR